MVDNPYEPVPPSPHEAGPGMLLRRGNSYKLPPIGSTRHHDPAHLRRQEWLGRLMLVLFLGIPAVGVLGMELGWWGR